MKIGKLTINFGHGAKPICAQLQKQHIKLPEKTCKLLEAEAIAIRLLKLHNILTPTEAHKAQYRLFNKINKTLTNTPS